MGSSSDSDPDRPTGAAQGRDKPPGKVRRWLGRVLLGLNPQAVRRAIVEVGSLAERHEETRRHFEAWGERFLQIERRLDAAEQTLRDVQTAAENLTSAEGRVGSAERRLDAAEGGLRGLQGEIEELRARSLPELDHRFSRIAGAVSELTSGLEELRDRRLPAAVARGDALVDRLASDIEEVASLVDRMMLREPLPVAEEGMTEKRLAQELADIQPVLLRELRGPADIISSRLEPYVDLLRDHQPVLDLGCGRGELLDLLRSAGIEAEGAEADPALAAAARRRGLKVTEGDVLDVLSGRPDASCGSVAAVHLVEHLGTADLVRALAEIRRVLRIGGMLVVECPNVATLRVGAHEFWLDPTHARPLPEKTLDLLLRAAGFEPVRNERLRPFPEAERLEAVASRLPDESPAEIRPVVEALRHVCRRLDEMLNGPRDVLIVARRAAEE